MRPLDHLPSIRAKLAVVIVFAVGMTVVLVYLLLGFALAPAEGFFGRIGGAFGFIRAYWWELLLGGAVAAAVALLLARLLALGMTRPLRDMAHAAAKMAQGDYSQRVRTASRDEVGELASAFNGMSAELEQVEKLRRELVANVSHELKTPISALRAHLENLLDGVEQPDRETIEVMLRQSERLGRLVDQLLDLSRLESGDIPMSLGAVSLRELAERVGSELAAAVADRRVRLDVRIPDDLPAVLADRERIHQVILNLLDNAVRFTPPGGLVTVAAARRGNRCDVRVSDNGPGIPREHLPFVFERFYRADPARAREDGGTGIGLAIVRSIVESHGGRIRAESEVGRGTTFVFDLPVAPVWTERPTAPPRPGWRVPTTTGGIE